MSERTPSRVGQGPAPADAGPERDQPPTKGLQLITNTSRPLALETPGSDLAGVGCVMAVEKIFDSDLEVPILYTIYQPLNDWGQFEYTKRGDLHLDIAFDEKSLRNFIYEHPMKQNLTLRIERHPYGFKSRYRDPPYIRCRSKQCSVDKTGSFKIGDYRIAVDEVTGRLGANQFNDNDPYFSACFFHLQCFEDLADTPDLVIRNIVVLDEREIHSKEPECTRINKMRVAPAAVRSFIKWRHTAVEKRSEDPDWQPPEKETLAVVTWQTSIRRDRKLTRVPRGITSGDIELICSTHPGWGGKRASGLSVAAMDKMVLEGRSGEMIASRNGKTGKRGVKEPGGITRKRSLSDTGDEDSEGSSPLAGSPIQSGITTAGPEGNSTGYGSETALYSSKRCRVTLTPNDGAGTHKS